MTRSPDKPQSTTDPGHGLLGPAGIGGVGSRLPLASQTEAVLAAGGHVADPDQRASRAFATDPSLFSDGRFHPPTPGMP